MKSNHVFFKLSVYVCIKQRATFLDRIKSEQQELQAVTEAYDELCQKHSELSSQAKVQAQHIYELEVQTQTQVEWPMCNHTHTTNRLMHTQTKL